MRWSRTGSPIPCACSAISAKRRRSRTPGVCRWSTMQFFSSTFSKSILRREIPPAIEPDRLYRYAQEALRLSSGEAAQALAWYSYNTCQFNTALAWFERANAWYPKEATAYGYALVLRRLHRREEFFDVVNRYDGLFPKMIEIIFPDNFYHPLTLCERPGAVVSAQPARSIGDMPVPGPATFRPEDIAALNEANMKRRNQFEFSRPLDRPPNISRSEFPSLVDPQNNLRFAAMDPRLAPLPRLAASEAAFVREAPPQDIPLVARRVPGVGPMPYERYGFTLLPAYNGQINASPPHSAQYASVGTPWAEAVANSPAQMEPQLPPDFRGPAPALVQQLQPDPRAQMQSARQFPTPANPTAPSNAYRYGTN